MTFNRLSMHLWEVACFDRTMESYQFPAERRAVLVYIYAAKLQTVNSSHVLQFILLRNMRVPWSFAALRGSCRVGPTFVIRTAINKHHLLSR
jgi:hypothetical protein